MLVQREWNMPNILLMNIHCGNLLDIFNTYYSQVITPIRRIKAMSPYSWVIHERY